MFFDRSTSILSDIVNYQRVNKRTVMFKRFTDRVTSAVASITGSGENGNSSDGGSDLQRLTSMGFTASDSQHALQIMGGNVEQAAEWLLMNASNTLRSPPTTMGAGAEDEDIQKAIAASLADTVPSPSRTIGANSRSAASRRAGEAAIARSDNTQKQRSRPSASYAKQKTPKTPTANSDGNGNAKAKVAIQSHPNVKVPKHLSQHDIQDKIIRCSQRVAPYAMAVDTLLKSLRQLQQNPTNPKYLTIDTSTDAFKRSLDVPGALDFLRSMGYRFSYARREVLELSGSLLDPVVLHVGISALEEIQRDSKEYQKSKVELVFDKEITQVLSLGDQDMQEALARSQFLSKTPSEPAIGGGIINVQLGSTTKIQRKFDGDDCLQDILNWLGAHGSVIPVKLEQKEWFLVNRNHSVAIPYNVLDLKEKTLQYIGCWPSARLAIIPFPPEPSDGAVTSSRGLGAAPMDAL